MGNTFRGGQDNPHKKASIALPRIEPELVLFIGQLEEIHREFGLEGAKKFIAETEKRMGLPVGRLAPLMAFVT